MIQATVGNAVRRPRLEFEPPDPANVENGSASAGHAPPPSAGHSAERLDSGLTSLALVAGHYRIAADPAQLRHQLALTGRLAETDDLLRAANLLQLKSRVIRRVDAKRLGFIPYPAIMELEHGGFVLLIPPPTRAGSA